MGTYAARFTERFGDVVAEERYVQSAPGRPSVSQAGRSTVAMPSAPTPGARVGFPARESAPVPISGCRFAMCSRSTAARARSRRSLVEAVSPPHGPDSRAGEGHHRRKQPPTSAACSGRSTRRWWRWGSPNRNISRASATRSARRTRAPDRASGSSTIRSATARPSSRARWTRHGFVGPRLGGGGHGTRGEDRAHRPGQLAAREHYRVVPSGRSVRLRRAVRDGRGLHAARSHPRLGPRELRPLPPVRRDGGRDHADCARALDDGAVDGHGPGGDSSGSVRDG